MRIGIDARAAEEELGGGGTLVRELLRALPTGEHDYVLFARREWPDAAAGEWVLSAARDPLWNVRTGLFAHRHCDVFVSTNSYLTAWFTRVPSVVVVYDLVAFDDSVAPQRRARWIERATLPLAVRRATALTTISHATADDLARRFPATVGKFVVTPLGARFADADDAPADEILARHGVSRPYVLAVGTLEPRKNLPRLIDAFMGLAPQVRDGHELVIVGAKGWEADETFAAMRAHPERIRALGHVSDAELPALYREAALFAYPSLHEGFGLPVLEAMAAGTPVLTSDRSSLPEVAGDAAIYCDPRDVESIRAGLERGLTDRRLAAALAEKGRARARSFSWHRFAAQTVEVAVRAVEEGRR